MTMPAIYPVTSHTEHVGPGSTFVVIKGFKTDGILYIEKAIEQGATKLVIQEDAQLPAHLLQLITRKNIILGHSQDPRLALAQLSAQAAGNPADRLKIIGITGTKGKTTTSFLLAHTLESAGHKVALLSTVYNRIGSQVFKAPLTTAQPDYLHQFLKLCVEQAVEYVVMEVAAQALTLHRVAGITFDGAIFTNFSQEHGEFYATMEDYFAAKEQLFAQTKKGAPKITNHDNARSALLEQKYAVTTISFIDASVDFCARQHDQHSYVDFEVNGYHYSCKQLVGNFNGYNALCVIALMQLLGISPEYIQRGLETFELVPGRMEQYILPNGARAIIDYAHNPSSYTQIITTLKQMAPFVTVVFGCGGERDKSKRSIMGDIASTLADRVVLTTDNPRSEQAHEIVSDILLGVKEEYRHKVLVELDREKAIALAYTITPSDGIFCLLGKGPDEYQEILGIKYPFSEKAILKQL